MEQNSNHVSYQPMQVWLQVQCHDLALPLNWLVDKTYCQCVGMGEVLSLAPKQKKLSDVCAAIDLLNQELSDFRYSSYAFLRGSPLTWPGNVPFQMGTYANRKREDMA